MGAAAGWQFSLSVHFSLAISQGNRGRTVSHSSQEHLQCQLCNGAQNTDLEIHHKKYLMHLGIWVTLLWSHLLCRQSLWLHVLAMKRLRQLIKSEEISWLNTEILYFTWLYLIAAINSLPVQPDRFPLLNDSLMENYFRHWLFSVCTDNKASSRRFGTHVSDGRSIFRRVRLNNPTPFGKTDFCTVNINTRIAFLIIIKPEPVSTLINWCSCFLIRMGFVKIITM